MSQRVFRVVSQPSVVAVMAGMVGVGVFGIAGEAKAASVCQVFDPGPDPATPGTLPYCVEEVNQQNADTIEITTSQTIELDSMLYFDRSASIFNASSGPGRIRPSASFPGDDLIMVGQKCPGLLCQGYMVNLSLTGVELDGAGLAKRGVEVMDGHGIEVYDSVIHGFGGGYEGGGIRARQKSMVTIMGSEFYDNAADDGGALWSEAILTQIVSSDFHDNVANYNGGAIKIGSGNFFQRTLDVYKTTFTRNFGNWGGAVQASAYNVVVRMELAELVGNHATDRGGAMHGKGEFNHCLFDGNRADKIGGGLYLVDETFLEDSTMTRNTSEVGGAIALVSTAGELFVDGSTLAENSVYAVDQVFGGALYVVEGQAKLLNSTLSENSAHSLQKDGDGGAIAVRSNGEVRLDHVTVVENEADLTGGLYTESGSAASLTSSYIVYSGGNGDCDIQGSLSPTTSMDSDGTCGGIDTGAPTIDPLAQNGGFTQTRLAFGDGQDAAQCVSNVDQRDQSRATTDCDMGAVEQ